jgi:phosphate-selective porin OprO/OprP
MVDAQTQVFNEINSGFVDVKNESISKGLNTIQKKADLLSEVDDLEIKIGGDLQFDIRYSLNDASSLINDFYLRRARLNLEGKFQKIFGFRIKPNFAGSKLNIQDAYLDIKPVESLGIRAGKFKSPVGLELLQSATNLMFVELSLTNNLVPNRDLGVLLSGSFLGGTINYQAGLFNGVIDGSNSEGDDSNDKSFVARLFLQPFKQSELKILNGFGLGIGSSFETKTGTLIDPQLPSYKSAGRQTFFKFRSTSGDAEATVIAVGKYNRISPQAYFYAGRFGLLTEYVLVNQNVKLGSNSAELTNSAYQVAVSFLLTDDKASYKGVTPQFSFSPADGTWGAFELAFRYNALQVDEDAFPVYADDSKYPSETKGWAIGLNWYLNAFYKIVLNYESTQFTGIDGSKIIEDENILLLRFQFAY